MTPLVTLYYGRQSIEKLTAQPFDCWHMRSSQYETYSCFWNWCNWFILIHLDIYIYIWNFPSNIFDIRTVIWAAFDRWSILYCMQGLFNVFVKHKNHLLATMCWDNWFYHATLRCSRTFLFAPRPSGGKNTGGQRLTHFIWSLKSSQFKQLQPRATWAVLLSKQTGLDSLRLKWTRYDDDRLLSKLSARANRPCDTFYCSSLLERFSGFEAFKKCLWIFKHHFNFFRFYSSLRRSFIPSWKHRSSITFDVRWGEVVLNVLGCRLTY